MAVVLDATIGGANANSFETLDEANAYFESRTPLAPPWVTTGDTPARALITATRVLSQLALPHRRVTVGKDGIQYRITSPQWTGLPATATQALPWPRTGMKDSMGRDIPADVIPIELKNAEAEYAGQLAKSDLTLDNSVSVQGITSVKAGSVSVSFKDTIEPKMIPDFVWALMPDSWFTDEIIEPALSAEFDVI